MKFVKDLKKGDAVMTPNNIPTKIKCIIITKCKNNTTYLVELSSGLQISPWFLFLLFLFIYLFSFFIVKYFTY